MSSINFENKKILILSSTKKFMSVESSKLLIFMSVETENLIIQNVITVIICYRLFFEEIF